VQHVDSTELKQQKYAIVGMSLTEINIHLEDLGYWYKVASKLLHVSGES